MKIFFPLLPVALSLGVLSAYAAPPSPQPANNHLPKPHDSSPVATGQMAPVSSSGSQPGNAAEQATAPASSPAPAPAPKASVTLDAYISDLASTVPLSKDEQTDVKTYYLDDGTKLQGILNDAALSSFEQEQQVDALRNARNAKIGALLNDVTRQAEFLKVESAYRVALVELAAQGGLVPTSPTPRVPEPTGTTPAQADQAVQAATKSGKMDTAPGE